MMMRGGNIGAMTHGPITAAMAGGRAQGWGGRTAWGHFHDHLSRSALVVLSMTTHIPPAGLRFRLAMVGAGFMCAGATTGTNKRQPQRETGRGVNNSALQLTDREQIPGFVKWPEPEPRLVPSPGGPGPLSTKAEMASPAGARV
jgi:hypothetical protein